MLHPTGESRCFVEGRVDTSGHCFIVSNHKVFFYDVAFRSSLGRFFGMSKKVSFVKNAFCVFIINGPNRWDFV